MSELPTGWKTASIPDLIGADGVFNDGDWVESKDQDPDGDVRLVQLADVGDGEFRDRSNRFMTSVKADLLRCTFMQKGDILVARMPDPLGRACIFPGDKKKAVTVVDVCIIRPGKGSVDPRWLMNHINAPQFRAAIESYESGTTRRRISRKNLARIEFPIPPLPEQRRIVDRIEELFSRLDAGVAALRHAKAQLQRYRQSVLAAAVTGQLTQAWREQHPDTEPAEELLERILEERRKQWNGKGKYKEPEAPETAQMPQVPENWVWARLDSLCAIGSGMSVSKNRKLKKPVEVPYLRVANVQRGRLILDEIKTMMVEKERLDDMRLKNGDILFNEGGDRDKLGRGWIWEGQIDPCITQNHVFRATPFDPELTAPKLLSHWGNSFGQQFFIDEGTQTTNLASINKGVLSSFPVPIPPIAEQHQILEQLEARTTAIDHLSVDVDDQLKRATKLRQAILKTAFSGELVSQNPTDLPAKSLLDEISAAKLKAAQEPKKPSPKKERRMPQKSLIQIISANPKGITPEALLGESEYTEERIEEFYRDLALIRNQIEEIKPKGDESLDWPSKSKILIKPKAKKK